MESGVNESKPIPFIVGVGASAGGLEPLTELFANADPSAPTAWVLVQHLSPDHKSFFVEIIQRKTKMTVQRAEHLDVIQPGFIYVIEPNTQIRVVDGHIESSQWRRKESAPASSIDILFESLAEGTEHHCAAVILSGSGTDGTRGAGLVREAGGMVVVQDPNAAAFDSMPRSAVRAKLADRVLPAAEIAPFLEAVARRRSPRSLSAAGGMQSILDYLRAEHGVEFHAYKPDGIQRRLNRRMDMLGIDDYGAYLERLKSREDELAELEQDLLIGVTSFFRDLDAFTQLQAHLTEYVSKHPKPEYRVWVAGCSTGEEAYSAAMVLDDVLADDGKQSTIKLFATDLNE
ncbi:MAG: chemotaxis protein CheB, partial [Myxococcota bacterium]